MVLAWGRYPRLPKTNENEWFWLGVAIPSSQNPMKTNGFGLGSLSQGPKNQWKPMVLAWGRYPKLPKTYEKQWFWPGVAIPSSQKPMKTQKLRESQLGLKKNILYFARFLRLSSTSTLFNVLIWCALDSPAPEQPFKCFERQHITNRKNFRDS